MTRRPSQAPLAAGLALSVLLHAAALSAHRGREGVVAHGVPLPVATVLTARLAAPAPASGDFSTASPAELHRSSMASADGAERAEPTGTQPLWIDTQRYYDVPELTLGPRPLRSIAPASVAAAPEAGRVLAGVRVNERGVVDDVAILASEPAGAFDEAVRHALRNTPFHPGMLAGVPVRSRLTIEIRFDPGKENPT